MRYFLEHKKGKFGSSSHSKGLLYSEPIVYDVDSYIFGCLLDSYCIVMHQFYFLALISFLYFFFLCIPCGDPSFVDYVTVIVECWILCSE